MVQQRKKSPTKTSRKRTPKAKTYVFAYQALNPIVNVDSKGTPHVQPLNGPGFVRPEVEEIRRELAIPVLETVTRADLEALTRNLEDVFNNRFQGVVRELSTQGEFETIRNTLDELRNRIDNVNATASASSQRSLERITNLIERSEEETRQRLSTLEQEIVQKIQMVNDRITELRLRAEEQQQQATITPEKGLNTREIIHELQGLEAELLASLNNVRDVISQEVVRRSEMTSLKITDFMIEIDALKENSNNNRDSIINEIRSLGTLLGKHDDKELQTKKEILELLRSKMDGLSNSNRLEFETLRTGINRLMDIVNKEDSDLEYIKKGLEEERLRERETIDKLVTELKNETRQQIDRIMEMMKPNIVGVKFEENLPENDCSAQEVENINLKETVQEKTSRVENLENEVREQKDTIKSLELEIKEKQFSGIDKREIDNLETRLQGLNDELSKKNDELSREKYNRVRDKMDHEKKLRDTENRIKAQEELINKAKLSEEETQRDLARVQAELRRTTANLEASMRDIKDVEDSRRKDEKLIDELQVQRRDLKKIEEEVVNILKDNGEMYSDPTNVNYNLATLEELIKDLKKQVEEKNDKIETLESTPVKQSPPQKIAKAPIARYVVIRSGNLLELVDNSKRTIDYTSEAKVIKTDLYTYSMDIMETQESIRRAIYDNEYVFYVRNNIVQNLLPGDISKLFDEYDFITPTIIEDITRVDVTTPSSSVAAPLIGKYVLSDIFSPTVDPNMTSNSNLVVASGVIKVFSYLDAIDLAISPFESYISKVQLANSLKKILRTVGREIPDQRKLIYDSHDLFVAQLLLIDDIRDYMNSVMKSLGRFSQEGIYNIEIRMILLDALLKAFLEMKLSLDRMRVFYGTKHFIDFKKEKGEIESGRLFSYVRLRADGNLIDPRFSILLNTQTPEAIPRTKLQISHQPYVLSSLSMNDAERPYYEHDVYGPFTRVFLPNDSNQMMANDIEEVASSLNSNKDVCTLSLGPSGSGKTSTLLYFRGSDNLLPSKGVIPLLMNKLDRRFTKVRVTAFEFTANYDPSAVGTENYWKKYDVFESPVIFKRKNQEWESERPGLTIETFSYSSSVDVCEKDSPFDDLTRSSYTFNEDSATTIGDFLSRMIDIRLNCGTPMNPVSSRTHLFLFLKFLSDGSTNEENSPTLIVADLAGREKSFDCSSEGILEVFSLNKYYPTLNKIVNDPLGQITDPSKTPLFDRSRAVLGFPATAISANLSKNEIYKDIVNPLSNYTLTELFNLLHLDTFFSYIKKNNAASGGGYVPDSKGLDVSSTFYKFLGRVFTYVIEQRFPEMLEKRLSNIDSQPLQLKTLLEKLEGRIENILRIIVHFARVPSAPGRNTLSGRSQYTNLKSEVKLTTDEFDKALELTKTYLEALMLIEYLSGVLREKPVSVCRYRNIEGEFINRSLNEFSNLILLASSGDSRGPMIHAECLPITCSFAGMDCLLPKNVPKGSKESAISQIIKEGTGKKSLNMDKMVFCVFVVLNISQRPKDDKIFRPLFDSAEPLLREVFQGFVKLKLDLDFLSYVDEGQPLTTPELPKNIRNMLSEFVDAYRSFMDVYKSETEVINTYRARLEYRGIDPNRILTDRIREEVYLKSSQNWNLMLNLRTEMLNVLTSPVIRAAPTQIIVELNSTVRKIRDFVEYLEIKNQDTSLGVLMFADDLVKRGLQPMSCTVFDFRESLLSSTVGWSNVQYKI